MENNFARIIMRGIIMAGIIVARNYHGNNLNAHVPKNYHGQIKYHKNYHGNNFARIIMRGIIMEIVVYMTIIMEIS
jgi:hypothetical protein